MAHHMKPPSVTLTLTLALVAGSLAMCQIEASGPIHSREVHAVVERVDHQNHTVLLSYSKEQGPKGVAWTQNTRFLHDSKPSSDEELKDGARATVRYRTPFFGKPIATSIEWVTESAHE